MKVFYTLIYRDLLRFFCQPMGYGLSLAFFGIQAYLFSIILHLLNTPQPHSVSPLVYLFSDSIVLHLFGFFIPALTIRCFAEERSYKTWEALASRGIPITQIVLSKFFSHFLLLAFLQGLTLIFPLVLAFHLDIDLGQTLSGYLGLLFVGGLWLSVSLFASCRIQSVVLAYLLGFTAIFALRCIPYFSVIISDPLYRPFFDTFNVFFILGKTSKGFMQLSDMLFLILGTGFFLNLTTQLLDLERYIGFGSWKRRGLHLFSTFLVALGIYFSLYISNHHGTKWDLSLKADLSPEFKSIIQDISEPCHITLMLPARAKLANYKEARDMIINLLHKMESASNSIKLRILDPDVDLVELEQLKKENSLPHNVLGGIILKYKDKTITIPYHQLVTQSILNVKGKPEKYIHSFHGEQQISSALNTLVRSGESPRVLIVEGQRELLLQSNIREGGTKFLAMLQQLDLNLSPYNPSKDPLPDLKNINLVIWLDPQDAPSKNHRNLIKHLFKAKIPLLMAKSANLNKSKPDQPWDLLSDYGLLLANHVILQSAYPSSHPLILPIHDYAEHPILSDLRDTACYFYQSDLIQLGVAADPRVRLRTMARTAQHSKITQQKLPQSKVLQSNQRFPTAMSCELESSKGKFPLLVLLTSRAPFENRFINEGANRLFIFKSIQWLLNGERELILPPRKPTDYRMNLNAMDMNILKLISMGTVPCLIILIGSFVWWRRNR